MNTDPREHISCLMDGEISRETGRFLVRRLGADEALCATWARYHLVRDCLRHQEGDQQQGGDGDPGPDGGPSRAERAMEGLGGCKQPLDARRSPVALVFHTHS